MVFWHFGYGLLLEMRKNPNQQALVEPLTKLNPHSSALGMERTGKDFD